MRDKFDLLLVPFFLFWKGASEVLGCIQSTGVWNCLLKTTAAVLRTLRGTRRVFFSVDGGFESLAENDRCCPVLPSLLIHPLARCPMPARSHKHFAWEDIGTNCYSSIWTYPTNTGSTAPRESSLHLKMATEVPVRPCVCVCVCLLARLMLFMNIGWSGQGQGLRARWVFVVVVVCDGDGDGVVDAAEVVTMLQLLQLLVVVML